MRLWYNSGSVGGQYAFKVYQKKTCALNAYWGITAIIPENSSNYACKEQWERSNLHQALIAPQTLAFFLHSGGSVSKLHLLGLQASRWHFPRNCPDLCEVHTWPWPNRISRSKPTWITNYCSSVSPGPPESPASVDIEVLELELPAPSPSAESSSISQRQSKLVDKRFK